MTEAGKMIRECFEIRKSPKQKKAFRDWLCETLREEGYRVQVEFAKNVVNNYNVVVGDPETAEVIFTAHYDTCAVLPIPNFITPRNMFWYLVYQLLLVLPMFAVAFGAMFAAELLVSPLWVPPLCMDAVLLFCVWWLIDGKANKHTANDNTSGIVTLTEILLTMPKELRDKVCVIYFDNEEKGLFGSGGFADRHKTARKEKLLINFDCVSDGDSIQLFPRKALKEDGAVLSLLDDAFLPMEGKTVEVVRSFGFYPSDQRHFARGVGVCALKKSRVLGYYMDKIHTGKDRVFDEKNIELLCRGAIRLTEKLVACKTETEIVG